jgi:glutamate dehydrogenase (NAD(P)+)
MEKRFDESAFNRIVEAIEGSTGKKFSDAERRSLVAGADEEDLVNSGLEETMITSWAQIKATRERLKNAVTPRIAAFVTAIDKIAVSYKELGIFP